MIKIVVVITTLTQNKDFIFLQNKNTFTYDYMFKKGNVK